ncbi:MAG: hypothetical protein CV045_03070 [Cyanobacteria bacterium M5B4]|nr:MAG: hypothetical protein CV045_03070 [Cyanobacteria bacterium M5B4]
MTPLFAFVACRDFYITCERNYNPSLDNKPVVLLDETDCIQALSVEAKELGLQRGVPVFLYASQIRDHKIVVYHINQLLCQDMNTRLQGMLGNFASPIEVWSPDRLFLHLFDPVDYKKGDKVKWIADQVATTIRISTGMYAHVGIAPTRTLAHLAACMGVKDFTDRHFQEQMLSRLGVGSIWGISPTYRDLLRGLGIFTALDFRNAEDHVIRQVMGGVGLRLALELRNISCLEVNDFPALVPEILHWRKFAEPLKTLSQLQETIELVTTLMGQQLQAQKLVARLMALSFYPPQGDQNFPTTLLKFPFPINDSKELVTQTNQAIQEVFTLLDSCAQLRVVLSGLSSPIGAKAESRQSESTMRRMDGVTQRMATSAIEIAEAGMQQLQQSRVNRRLTLPKYPPKAIGG